MAYEVIILYHLHMPWYFLWDLLNVPKNNRQIAFSYNPISMVRAGKPESFSL